MVIKFMWKYNIINNLNNQNYSSNRFNQLILFKCYCFFLLLVGITAALPPVIRIGKFIIFNYKKIIILIKIEYYNYIIVLNSLKFMQIADVSFK